MVLIELFGRKHIILTHDSTLGTIRIGHCILGSFPSLGTMQEKSLTSYNDRKHCETLQFGKSTKSKILDIIENIFSPFVLTSIVSF